MQEDNPYAPPQAAISEIAPLPAAAKPAYFAVSVGKFVVMSLGTLGIYQYYVIYHHWKLYRERTLHPIAPLPRAIFAIFFYFQLVDRIDDDAARAGTQRLSAAGLAIPWILVSLTWKAPDPYWLIAFLTIFLSIPVQQAVNDLNRKLAPDHDTNSRIEGWNWLAVILGLPFLAMAVYGAFVPA